MNFGSMGWGSAILIYLAVSVAFAIFVMHDASPNYLRETGPDSRPDPLVERFAKIVVWSFACLGVGVLWPIALAALVVSRCSGGRDE
jgi:hypothetical protein